MRPAAGRARLRGWPVSRSSVVRRLAGRSGGTESDDGRAMIEVIFLAVLILMLFTIGIVGALRHPPQE